MNSKANGCWPVLAVAVVLALGSASAQAACETAKCDRTAAADSAASSEGTVKSSRHSRHHAHHINHSRHETKSADRTKSEKVRVATAGELPPAIANAQAQMAADQAPAASTPPAPAPMAAAAPAEQPQSADTETPVVAADELNEVDRAAMADKPNGRILHLLPQTQQLSSAAPEDTWTQTSLLGKMFVVMGGCLTLASAARMFIA